MIVFRMRMCSSRVLLGLESSARTRSHNQHSSADVFDSSPVEGCKYERCLRYISTDGHTLVTTSWRKWVDYVKRSCTFVMHLGMHFCELICKIFQPDCHNNLNCPCMILHFTQFECARSVAQSAFACQCVRVESCWML